MAEHNWEVFNIIRFDSFGNVNDEQNEFFFKKKQQQRTKSPPNFVYGLLYVFAAAAAVCICDFVSMSRTIVI